LIEEYLEWAGQERDAQAKAALKSTEKQ